MTSPEVHYYNCSLCNIAMRYRRRSILRHENSLLHYNSFQHLKHWCNSLNDELKVCILQFLYPSLKYIFQMHYIVHHHNTQNIVSCINRRSYHTYDKTCDKCTHVVGYKNTTDYHLFLNYLKLYPICMNCAFKKHVHTNYLILLSSWLFIDIDHGMIYLQSHTNPFHVFRMFGMFQEIQTIHARKGYHELQFDLTLLLQFSSFHEYLSDLWIRTTESLDTLIDIMS
uniref:Uncharacterized protein n=1 Tax=viral metagenome TaxID=1070528 RepID=A0A6C0CQ36_9ZZZZ